MNSVVKNCCISSSKKVSFVANSAFKISCQNVIVVYSMGFDGKVASYYWWIFAHTQGGSEAIVLSFMQFSSKTLPNSRLANPPLSLTPKILDPLLSPLQIIFEFFL